MLYETQLGAEFFMLSHSHGLTMEVLTLHVLTQVAAECLKQCHLKDKDVTYFTVLKKRG
jgi:hypothetical protein